VLMRQPGADPNRLQAATAFIDYVSSRSSKWADSGMIPAREAVLESPEFPKLEGQAAFAEEIPYARFPPPVAGIEDVRELTLDPAINVSVLLEAQPREALRDAAERANALLADNRQKYGAA